MAPKTFSEDQTCWICGATMYANRWRSDAHFCSIECKQAAYRIRRGLRDRINAGEPHDPRMRALLANPKHPAWEGVFRQAREKA